MLIKLVTVLSLLGSGAACGLAGGFSDFRWLWMLPVLFAGLWLCFALLTFLVIWFFAAIIDTDRPQQKDSPFYRRLLKYMCQAIVSLLRMRLEVTGLEQLPRDGRFLLVCNHLHILDPVVLLHVFRDSQLAFISKRENQNMFIVGKVMHKILCQPINRENDREALKTILSCIRLLKEDLVSVAVFPEGYTSRDGRLQSFRCGVFKIAQKAKVPIVVCTLENTQRVFANALRLKKTAVRADLVTVIPPEELTGVTAVEIGQRVHQLMAQQLGPEYQPLPE